MSDPVAVLPCPFCGNTDPEIDEIDLGIWAIVCGCGAQGPVENFHDCAKQDAARAIELWNARSA